MIRPHSVLGLSLAFALGVAIATAARSHADPPAALDRPLTERLVRAQEAQIRVQESQAKALEAQVHALQDIARAVERSARSR